MTGREIRAHLQEIYGVAVSPDLSSAVTDGVLDEVRAWQARPRDAIYPILYLDALQVKVTDQGRVSNKAMYLAIGVNLQGLKEVLGM
jgi:putative transposase